MMTCLTVGYTRYVYTYICDCGGDCLRSLSACQGVLLLVDANQGVEAQTMANFFLARSRKLVIIPVLNKIDVKNVDIEVASEQLTNVLSVKQSDILKVRLE